MFDNTMDEAAARRVIRHLEACGGSDLLLIDGRLYRLTVTEVPPEDMPEAVRQCLEDES